MHLHEIVIGGSVGRSEAAAKYGWLGNEEVMWPGTVVGTHNTGAKQVVQFIVQRYDGSYKLHSWNMKYLEAISW